MLHKQHNSVITLAILLSLAGVIEPATANLVAQSQATDQSVTLPDQLPQDTNLEIAASNSTNSINQSLKEGFTAKYPNAKVNITVQSADDDLKSLSEGKADLAAIGRNLTAAESAEGFKSVPISREKIAVIVSKNNPYNGSLTINQFAQIFRGEITDWSKLGGNAGEIKMVDLPNSNDTREAFPNYPVFQAQKLATGSNALQVQQDSTDQMVAQLGNNGIGYGVANDVLKRDDVKVLSMHQTQPDDQRYPFSQPFNLVYKGTPNEAALAFLGFATTEGGQQVINQRVGSVSTVKDAAIALGQLVPAINNINAKIADASSDGTTKALEGSGQVNPDLEGSGQVNPDLEGSGEANPDLEGSGEANPDLEGSGEANPDLEGSGEANPDLEGSGEANSAAKLDNVSTTVAQDSPDNGGNVPTTDNKSKWWWWLPLLLLPIGALALYLFKRDEKSDQEPAVSNIPPRGNPPGEEIPLDPNDNLAVTGGKTNLVGDVSNIDTDTDTLGTTSKLGGAALATGAVAAGAAAAAKLNRDRNRETDRDIDLDLDLDDEDTSVAEIPSNPVNEFTSQTTVLQTSDQPTKLQTDDLDHSIDRPNFELLDNAASLSVGKAANNKVENDLDLDLDLGYEDTSIAEIPSTPVNEFTDPVTKLQPTDQPTKLQIEDIDDSIDHPNFELLDNAASLSAGAMASGLIANRIATDTQDNAFTVDTQEAEVLDREDTTTDATAFDWTDNTSETPTSDFITDQVTTDTQDNAFTVDTQEAEVLDREDTTTDATAFDWTDSSDRLTEVEDNSFSVDPVDTEAVNLSIDDQIAVNQFTDQTTQLQSTNQYTRIQNDLSLDDDLNSPSVELVDNGTVVEQATSESRSFTEQNNQIIDDQVIEPDLDDSGIYTTNSDFTANIIADAETSLDDPDYAQEEIVFDGSDEAIDISLEDITLDDNSIDGSLDDITFEDYDNRSLDDISFEDNSINASLDDITFEDYDNRSLDDISFEDNSIDASLDDITFEDYDNTSLDDITFEDNSINASLDDITFDDRDNNSLDDITFEDYDNSSLDDITFEDYDNTSLDDITFDDNSVNNTTNTLGNNYDVSKRNQELNLEDINFGGSTESSTNNWMSSEKSEIIDFDTESESSDDLNNISTWLDGLETSNQNTDDISQWLDNLNTNEQDYTNQNNNSEETEDISFQFLEDIIDKDNNSNKDNK
ncbi:hypothetical protein NIES4102_33400 [Chondrocystis sp. NIES-4102]|nr:hypothetical protein NIES4102_33400 [Chondrocystis sp. NIES-4102]